MRKIENSFKKVNVQKYITRALHILLPFSDKYLQTWQAPSVGLFTNYDSLVKHWNCKHLQSYVVGRSDNIYTDLIHTF